MSKRKRAAKQRQDDSQQGSALTAAAQDQAGQDQAAPDHPAAVKGQGAQSAHTIMVHGVAVDPTAIEGLVAYHLGKRYRARPVVRDVTIGVRRGEAVGLLGPNGAGKTTCFYMITGLVRPDAGAIYLDGTDVTEQPMYERARGGVGYLPQEASIFRGMTVEQNILAVLEVVDRDSASRRSKVDRLLGEFSVSHLRKVPALALSGGERRRVEIARCLATNPSYILLDEPLAGIDPIAVADIRDIVSHLKDRGIGVLITDHNVRDTLEIVDRAYIMHEGEVLREGTPKEIVADANVRRVYLGESFTL
jgi:lipopolysaccharide export system ATP-binding protein